MTDTCRISIRAGAAQVDLSLPGAVPVAALMPAVVGIAAKTPGSVEAATNWQLSRLGQAPLEQSMTLCDNGVRDGELLVLTPALPSRPAPRFADVAEVVAAAGGHAQRGWTPRVADGAAAASSALFGLLGAALWWRGVVVDPQPLRAVVPGIIGGAAFAAGVVAGRIHGNVTAATALFVPALAFSAVAGCAAVPGDPGAPHALLASALIAALCATAIRLTGGGLAVLTAAVPMSLLVSIVSLGCMLTSASRPAAGAVLAATAVGLLSFAPRLAILIAQLPLTELDDDRQAAKAIGAHTALTCLVCGFSLSALLGVACAAPDGIAGSSFTAAIASALLLRARWHTDMAQRAAVLAGGILTLAVGFAAAAASWPALTDWQGVAAAGVGAAVLGLGAGAAAASPLVRRAVDFMECVALAVVAPLACWVCGVYGLVLA